MKKRIVVFILLLAVVGSGIWIYRNVYRGREADPDVIRISGNIEVDDAEVSFKVPGVVEERLVSEGDTYEAGQVIARLDSVELAQEVALRKAEVMAAQAVLAELEAGSRPEEIARGEASLGRAQAELERLRAEYDRDRQLFRRNVISEREFDQTRANYEVAEAGVREAREELALLEQGPRTEKIDRARAELQRAREALTLAETRLGYATLVSPTSGAVLSENIEAGEYVSPGTPVVTIGNLEDVWLRGFINETDLGRVKLGQKAFVTTDTYPGKRYEGRVTFISSQAEFTPKTVETEEERVELVYRVKVSVPNPHMELKPGMPGTAEIVVGPEG